MEPLKNESQGIHQCLLLFTASIFTRYKTAKQPPSEPLKVLRLKCHENSIIRTNSCGFWHSQTACHRQTHPSCSPSPVHFTDGCRRYLSSSTPSHHDKLGSEKESHLFFVLFLSAITICIDHISGFPLFFFFVLNSYSPVNMFGCNIDLQTGRACNVAKKRKKTGKTVSLRANFVKIMLD